MNNLVQDEYSQFGSFQATWETLAQLDPRYLGDLAAWAQSTGDLYTFLSQSPLTNTPPAGSSLPTIDPAGTYSGPGASAPTPESARHIQRSGRERADALPGSDGGDPEPAARHIGHGCGADHGPPTRLFTLFTVHARWIKYNVIQT